MRLFFLFLVSVFCTSASAQSYLDVTTVPYADRFDFLIGEWHYETGSASGTGSYTKSEASGVVTEHIDGIVGTQAFVGLSMFVFNNEASETIKQDWFDSLGNHLSNTITFGAYEQSDVPVPIAEFTHQGNRFRHIWYEITEDRFMTDLLMENDSGTFVVVRHMPYVRM